MPIDVGKVGMVPLESIIVEDRAREVMGDLDSIEANMKEIGLTTPLTMKDNQDGTYTLLAGERRLRILEKNGVLEVPARIYGQDLTMLEMKIIEKSENFFRKDMEYWEFDRLTMEIHTMQQELHGAKAPGPGDTGWSTENTGELMGGISKGFVSQAIKRAEAREAFPGLFDNCKTQSDASKVLKKIDEAMVKQGLAQKLASDKTNSTLSQLSKYFVVGDFFKGVKQIPDGAIHLVEIDPPYAINIKDVKRSDGESQYQLQEYNEIPSEYYMDGDPDGPWRGMNQLLRECYRVMNRHSWLLCWFAPEPWFIEIYGAIRKAGFETTRMCAIWTKPSGQSKRPEIHLPNAYEMFFYAWKGRPALARPRGSNIFDYAPISPNQKTHPTERPVELTDDMYETFAFPGSRILIPFLGSGNGLISAHKLGMSPIGFELGKGNKDSFLVKVHNLK